MVTDETATEQPAPPGDGLELVREESRHVVDAQLRTLQETDRKAVTTARVDALIVGLLLSAASLVDSPADAVSSLLAGGTALVIASLACAVLTYSVDRPNYGVGPGFVDEVTGAERRRGAIERDLVSRYGQWIEDNGDEIASNGTYLLFAQGLLVLGLTGISSGVYLFVT
jgi:hypothetical protein